MHLAKNKNNFHKISVTKIGRKSTKYIIIYLKKKNIFLPSIAITSLSYMYFVIRELRKGQKKDTHRIFLVARCQSLRKRSMTASFAGQCPVLTVVNWHHLTRWLTIHIFDIDIKMTRKRKEVEGLKRGDMTTSTELHFNKLWLWFCHFILYFHRYRFI